MQLPAPTVERLLDTWPVGRLATLGPEGRPHLVPVVFARHGAALWSPIDAKPKREGELARVRNLERDPRVALLLDRYGPDWSRLWWIRLDGRAEVVSARDPERDATLREVVAALRAKYPQYRHTPLFRVEPVLIRIREERRTSWCAGDAVLDELRGA